MNNYELFSENYGCYFSVVTTILESAANGISREDIDTIVSENAFYESAFHLLPKLFSGEWSLLEKKEDGLYYSKIQSQKLCKPLTSLELAWLKAILNDKRIRLFLEDDEYFALLKILENIDPLFKEEDFHYFDRAADADPFDNTEYTQCFKTILAACINKEPVKIHYESG
ncbi:WYL domain-containing protein, partial [Tyzzerella sp. OttesenSCG-928-J15]|nr:WYL domain-containing protein [Tyzzerella sp. OttesenSCG-928-J15]